MRERDIENYLRTQVKKVFGKEGAAMKFISPGTAGVPDRLCSIRGKMFFVELKVPGGKLTDLQKAVHKQLRATGAVIYVIDSKEGVDDLIKKFDLGG